MTFLFLLFFFFVFFRKKSVIKLNSLDLIKSRVWQRVIRINTVYMLPRTSIRSKMG